MASRVSSPRASTLTARCGACSVPPGPGTRPGMIVLNAERPVARRGDPAESVARRIDRTILRIVRDAGICPAAFACQTSISASGTDVAGAVADRALDRDVPSGGGRLTTDRRRRESRRPKSKNGPTSETASDPATQRSIGVAFDPRSTMSNVNPSAHSGSVTSRSKFGDQPRARALVRDRVEDRIVAAAADRPGNTSA